MWKPRLAPWARTLLFLSVLGWLAVFGVALWIDPYPNGEVQLMGTHQQLGLQPCTFQRLVDFPCPSCGMTTSFALLVRGDLWNSARANFAGTMLALYGVLYIPWCLWSVWKAEWAWVRSPEPWFIRLIMLFVTTMILRWGIVVLLYMARRPAG